MRTSQSTPQLLALVLALGNVLNAGSARAGAKGFRLEVLPTPATCMHMHVHCTHMHAHCMHTSCTLHAHCMHAACTMHAHCMHNACTMHAQCVHAARTPHAHAIHVQVLLKLAETKATVTEGDDAGVSLLHHAAKCANPTPTPTPTLTPTPNP